MFPEYADNYTVSGFLIGANDLLTEATFLFPDGSAVQSAPWHSGQPDNNPGDEEKDFVKFEKLTDTWGWTNLASSDSQPIMCQASEYYPRLCACQTNQTQFYS